MCRFVGTVPDISGLVWPSFRPNSGRTLKVFRSPFSSAEGVQCHRSGHYLVQDLVWSPGGGSENPPIGCRCISGVYRGAVSAPPGFELTLCCTSLDVIERSRRDERTNARSTEKTATQGIRLVTERLQLGPKTPLERRGSSCSAGCTTNQPPRPILRPFRLKTKNKIKYIRPFRGNSEFGIHPLQ